METLLYLLAAITGACVIITAYIAQYALRFVKVTWLLQEEAIMSGSVRKANELISVRAFGRYVDARFTKLGTFLKKDS